MMRCGRPEAYPFGIRAGRYAMTQLTPVVAAAWCRSIILRHADKCGESIIDEDESGEMAEISIENLKMPVRRGFAAIIENIGKNAPWQIVIDLKRRRNRASSPRRRVISNGEVKRDAVN